MRTRLLLCLMTLEMMLDRCKWLVPVCFLFSLCLVMAILYTGALSGIFWNPLIHESSNEVVYLVALSFFVILSGLVFILLLLANLAACEYKAYAKQHEDHGCYAIAEPSKITPRLRIADFAPVLPEEVAQIGTETDNQPYTKDNEHRPNTLHRLLVLAEIYPQRLYRRLKRMSTKMQKNRRLGS